MKCDETRPACLKCTRKGIQCGGYWREFKWSFKHQPAQTDSSLGQAETGTSSTEDPPTGREEDTRSLPGDDPSSFLDSIDQSYSPSPSATVESILDGDFLAALEQPDWTALETSPVPASATLPTLRRNSAANGRRNLDIVASEPTRRNPTPLNFEMPMFLSSPSMDTSSLLIINWFEQVCPAWSGFDSNVNLNRNLAKGLWHDSLPVFNSLQSMSAAFLSTRLPHMRQPALRFMKTAAESIQTEIAMLDSQSHLETVPTGLLFSLFCLGTTVCWVDARQLGLPFFRQAKSLLRRLNREFSTAREDDREVLAFFNKSLTYCEMLLAVVSNEDSLPEMDETGDGLSTQPDLERNVRSIDSSPHPWTGISTLTSRLFAQSIRLCRSFRRSLRRQQQHMTRDVKAASEAFQQAQKLEEQLLELEFPSVLQMRDTGDHRTPWLHLARVAEAYQLSSLLQLYQTFPDLTSLRLPMKSTLSNGGHVPWEEWITPLSLRLVRVLEQIPPHSGSRAIQPLLYISASTGLRYDMATSLEASTSPGLFDLGIMGFDTQSLGDNCSLSECIDQIEGTEISGVAPNLISRMSLGISNARQFIMGRLGILENSLPPKPVIVARELIRAIWDAYDSEITGFNAIHWVDVMEDKNLRSMFG
ncbi:Fc.00g034540.m01.CDS01 [Cosmosporella sp. VM-42]